MEQKGRIFIAATDELLADGYPRPTMEEARMWMLEKHGIDITVPNHYHSDYWESCIRKWTKNGFVDTGLTGCDGTREGAVSDAVYTALAYIREPEQKKTWWQRMAESLGFDTETEVDKRNKYLVELLRADFPPLNLEP